jgi:hypothetical protein
MKIHRQVWLARVPLVMVALSSMAACATTASDFRIDSLRPDDGALVGKMEVIYNGQLYTDHCLIVVGGTTYKLDESGLVLLRVKPGLLPLGVVQCQDTSPYHYAFQGANFVAEGNGALTYFGNATVTWVTTGGLKVSSMFGAIGALVDASSNDGHAIMSVIDDPAPVHQQLVTRIGTNPPIATHLLTKGR